jgi:hypothetical protein
MKHRVLRATALLACGWLTLAAGAQTGDFKIAWTTVGEVVSSGQNTAPLQRDTKISRVDVQPTIIEVAVGNQLCLDSLQLQAIGADGKPVAGVPLSIAVRADHKVPLQLTHLKGICMRPARSGEYPIRFTSKVPAADATLRGAQIFLRAR